MSSLYSNVNKSKKKLEYLKREYLCAVLNYEMKKLLPYLFIILSFSIITEQYFYSQNGKLFNTELSCTDNIPAQNTEVQNDCTEFITLQSDHLKIVNIQRSKIKTHIININIQEYYNFIWQPPKSKV